MGTADVPKFLLLLLLFAEGTLESTGAVAFRQTVGRYGGVAGSHGAVQPDIVELFADELEHLDLEGSFEASSLFLDF